MTVLVKHDTTEKTSGSSFASSGDSLMKISSGSAALASLMIYRMMAMYAVIIGLDAQQKQNMTMAQGYESQSQAHYTEQAGSDYGKSLIISGALTVGTALLSLGATVAMSRYGDSAEATKEASGAEQESNLSKNLASSRMTLEPEEVNAGNITANEEEEQQINQRVSEFRDGKLSNAKYENGQLDETSVKAIRRMKVDAEENQEGLKRFDAAVSQKRDDASRDLNSARLKSNNAQQGISAWAQRIDQVGSAGSSGVQGYGNAQKGKDDAGAALTGSAANMAGTAVSDMGNGMQRAADAQLQEIQILQKIQDSSSGR